MHHQVGDVAVDEQLARRQAHDLVRRHAAVGAADPQVGPARWPWADRAKNSGSAPTRPAAQAWFRANRSARYFMWVSCPSPASLAADCACGPWRGMNRPWTGRRLVVIGGGVAGPDGRLLTPPAPATRPASLRWGRLRGDSAPPGGARATCSTAASPASPAQPPKPRLPALAGHRRDRPLPAPRPRRFRLSPSAQTAGRSPYTPTSTAWRPTFSTSFPWTRRTIQEFARALQGRAGTGHPLRSGEGLAGLPPASARTSAPLAARPPYCSSSTAG